MTTYWQVVFNVLQYHRSLLHPSPPPSGSAPYKDINDHGEAIIEAHQHVMKTALWSDTHTRVVFLGDRATGRLACLYVAICTYVCIVYIVLCA